MLEDSLLTSDQTVDDRKIYYFQKKVDQLGEFKALSADGFPRAPLYIQISRNVRSVYVTAPSSCLYFPTISWNFSLFLEILNQKRVGSYGFSSITNLVILDQK